MNPCATVARLQRVLCESEARFQAVSSHPKTEKGHPFSQEPRSRAESIQGYRNTAKLEESRERFPETTTEKTGDRLLSPKWRFRAVQVH